MKTLYPLNFSALAQAPVAGHERFVLAPATETTVKVAYKAELRNLPTRKDVHPAQKDVGKDEVAKAGGGNSLNSLKGGRCRAHNIFGASTINTNTQRTFDK